MSKRIGTRSGIAAALAAALVLGAGPARGDEDVDVVTDSMPAMASHDDALALVEAGWPGFGGMFVDEASNTVYMYSTQPFAATEAGARQAVTSLLGIDLSQRRVRVVSGAYSFTQLNDWHGRLRDVLTLPGAVSTDIDDAKNRLTVGVEQESQKQAVAERLAALSIPREAVDIVTTPPVRAENLTAFHRPLVGGLQIAFERGTSQFACTLGFNAVRDGLLGFVTNSHCTAVQGGVEGTPIYQPVVNAARRAGAELADPTYGPIPGCPAGRICRQSDSAFIQLDIGVTPRRGVLARPAGFNSVAWNGATANRFRIVREAGLVVGQMMQKIGRTTGRTRGRVLATCVNVNVAGTNITQLCQGQAAYTSLPGDSGSPVFRITNAPQPLDVALTGIHWGSGGIFSPIGNIEAELGALATCVPARGC